MEALCAAGWRICHLLVGRAAARCTVLLTSRHGLTSTIMWQRKWVGWMVVVLTLMLISADAGAGSSGDGPLHTLKCFSHVLQMDRGGGLRDGLAAQMRQRGVPSYPCNELWSSRCARAA